MFKLQDRVILWFGEGRVEAFLGGGYYLVRFRDCATGRFHYRDLVKP